MSPGTQTNKVVRFYPLPNREGRRQTGRVSQRMPALYKPDAGNQHARFDERGREPERGSSEHSHRTRPRLYRIWVPLGSCRTGVQSELVTREAID